MAPFKLLQLLFIALTSAYATIKLLGHGLQSSSLICQILISIKVSDVKIR